VWCGVLCGAVLCGVQCVVWCGVLCCVVWCGGVWSACRSLLVIATRDLWVAGPLTTAPH
jgi:hypothetical protein